MRDAAHFTCAKAMATGQCREFDGRRGSLEDTRPHQEKHDNHSNPGEMNR
jgi:hypothetical protein